MKVNHQPVAATRESAAIFTSSPVGGECGALPRRRYANRFTSTLLLLVVALAGRLRAQTNETPARLAIIPEAADFATVADLLTVELSAKPQVQVLERAEIEKLYREQQLSAANRDYVKLGQVLGADGLLFMNLTADGTNRFLSARLVAVKPGVVLENLRSPWPVPDAPGWARWVANHFTPLLPKLSVSAKDAIPISVVNLRSAVRSVEAQELERQLTVLLIERLTRERELFVLERRRMDLLSGEKELPGMGESTFWSGSYLLDGTIDRDGYSKEVVTVHARLAPPQGGASIALAVEGARTDLSGVIDQQARKIMESLKRSSSIAVWKPDAEAATYLEEGRWAMRWGSYGEAQTAFACAWALGMRTPEANVLRIEAYRLGGENAMGRGMTIIRAKLLATFSVPPDGRRADQVLHGLELYQMGTARAEELDTKARLEWQALGCRLLSSAGRWLQQYYFTPEARVEHKPKLAAMRSLAKQIAATLAQSPKKDDAEFLGTLANFGVFWCETPEEGVQLWREFIRLRKYGYILSRATPDESLYIAPTLTGWEGKDRRRVPEVWTAYVRELCNSTDPAGRVCGRYLQCLEAGSFAEFTNAFSKAVEFRPSTTNSPAERLDGTLLMGVWALNPRLILTPDETAALRRLKDDLRASQSGRADFLSEPPPPSRRNEAFPRTPWPPAALTRVATNRPVASPKPAAPAAAPPDPGEVLTVDRFWAAPLVVSNDYGSCLPGSVISMHYREGNLWLEAVYDGQSVKRSHEERVFFRVSLHTFKTDTIRIDPARHVPLRLDRFGPTDRTFEVLGDSLFVSSLDGIHRYDCDTKTWSILPAPIQEHCRITGIGNRLFLSSANAMLEISPDGKETRVLASTRRKPPITLLDRREHLKTLDLQHFAPVVAGADGSIVALVGGAFYLLAKGSTDWIELPGYQGRRDDRIGMSESGILVLGPTADAPRNPGAAELVIMRSGSTSLELLLTLPPQVTLGRTSPPPPKQATWTVEPRSFGVTAALCLDTEGVWFLGNRLPLAIESPQGLVISAGKLTRLMHFKYGYEKPFSYSLRFAANEAASKVFKLLGTMNGPAGSWASILSAPEGVIIGGQGVPGFWLVPRSELELGRSKQRDPNPASSPANAREAASGTNPAPALSALPSANSK
jgi:hypothetical protein